MAGKDKKRQKGGKRNKTWDGSQRERSPFQDRHEWEVMSSKSNPINQIKWNHNKSNQKQTVVALKQTETAQKSRQNIPSTGVSGVLGENKL